MRVPAPPTPSTEFDSVSPSTVSRFPSISRIQTSDGNGTFQASPKVEARINQMQGNGQTLPAEEQDFFEERMGYDFSYVRVHTDANAVQASRDIQAKAFTVGNNIAFSEGTYRPGTDEGRRLLAHELTHVVQQISTRVQCKPKYTNASRSTFTSSSDIFHSSLLQHHQASYGFLQRQCACGKPILTGQECENCRKGQQETFPQGMSNNTTFNQASDQTVPINSLPPTNKTDFRNSMANISLETNTQNSIQRQVSGNQPSTPEEYLICLIMCACEVAPQVGSTGNLLRQQCVSQFLQMIERGMNYVTSFKAEVSYDMTSRPPAPLCHPLTLYNHTRISQLGLRSICQIMFLGQV